MPNPTGIGGWKKGQSGNPGGRAKKALSLVYELEKLLRGRGPEGEAERRTVARKLIELAKAGNLEAIKYCFDRMDGRPPESLQLSGPDKGPVKVERIDSDPDRIAAILAILIEAGVIPARVGEVAGTEADQVHNP